MEVYVTFECENLFKYSPKLFVVISWYLIDIFQEMKRIEILIGYKFK